MATLGWADLRLGEDAAAEEHAREALDLWHAPSDRRPRGREPHGRVIGPAPRRPAAQPSSPSARISRQVITATWPRVAVVYGWKVVAVFPLMMPLW